MCYQVWAQCVLEKMKSNQSRHDACLGMGLVHLGTTCVQPEECWLERVSIALGMTCVQPKEILTTRLKGGSVGLGMTLV
jgi:hypothetical protein